MSISLRSGLAVAVFAAVLSCGLLSQAHQVLLLKAELRRTVLSLQLD